VSSITGKMIFIIAFLFTPVVLVFCVLMDVRIAVGHSNEIENRIAQNLNVAYMMGFFALVSSLLLFHFLRHLKTVN
jgi:hypothetical protein